MALEKDKVDDLIVDFVVRNEDDLVSNKKENPALYDSVMSALSLLARKYGSGVQPAKIIDQYKPAPEPAPIVPEPAPSNALNFEVGDIFFRKDSSGKKLYIKEIYPHTGAVLIGLLEVSGSSLSFTTDDVKDKFEKNLWVKTGDKFMPLPNNPQAPTKPMYFKVGDVFYHKEDKKEKYYIHSIDKDANFVLVGSAIGSFSGTTSYNLDEANLLMNNGTWVFNGEIHMPNKGLPFNEGDIFVVTATGKKYIFKSVFPTKNKINGNEEYQIAKFDEPNVVYAEVDIKEIIKNIDKKYWEIVGNINDKKPAAKVVFKDGDIFEVGSNVSKMVIKAIDGNEVEIAELSNPDVAINSLEFDKVQKFFDVGSWKITGNINVKKPTSSPFQLGDIVLFVKAKEDYLVRAIDPYSDEISFAKIDTPNTTAHKYSLSVAMAYLDNGLLVIKPKSISSDPTIEEGDLIRREQDKGKNKSKRFVVSMIKDGIVYLSDVDNPDVLADDYRLETAIKKLISREWEKMGKFVMAKSVPKKTADPVTAAIKKTAGKTKKVVTPEEKELLDAIKALKPLLEFDSDVQKEIDDLNAKLAELRNKKD